MQLIRASNLPIHGKLTVFLSTKWGEGRTGILLLLFIVKHEHILNDNSFSLKTIAEWKTEIL